MKPNDVFIEEHGSGFSVTVRFHVGREEELGQYLTERIFNKITASMRRDEQPEPEASSIAAEETAGTSAEVPASPRRRRTQAGSREPTESPTAAASAEPAPTSRRRRAASPETATSGSAGKESTTPSPSSDAKAAGVAQANPPIASDAATTSSRRRRSAGGSAEPAATASKSSTTSPSDKKYSDADLSKAASDAARSAGVAKVMAVLEEFGVGKVNELGDAQRSKFVKRMAALSK